MSNIKNFFTTVLDIVLASLILLVVLIVGNAIIVLSMLGLMLWFTPNSVASIYKAFIGTK